MITYITTQSISDDRLALYAEYNRLYKAASNDRVAAEKRREVWEKLVKSPTVVETSSTFDEETNTKTIHLEWRE